MIPEGFKDIKTHEPPLWEDVMFVLEDGRRVMGYYNVDADRKGEYFTTDEKRISGVIAWKRTYEI